MFHQQKPLLGARLTPGHPLARGLVGCWIMNEGSGDKIFDLSGNGNDGTQSGGVAWEGGNIHYDGTTGYHNIPYSPELYCPTEMTVCFRMKCDIVNHADLVPAIVSMYDYAGGNRMWGITPCNGNNPDTWEIMVSSNGATNNRKSFTSAITLDLDWHTVAVTAQNQDKVWSWYDNGIYKSKITEAEPSGYWYTYTNQESWLRIGGLSDAYNFDGIVEYVMIYNRILTPQEIQSLHANPYQMFEQDPIWMFGQGGAGVTTAAPTTTAPTTLASTTLAPTTLASTTLAPTTLAPTTLAPTTLAPTTLPPTTLAPTTLAPTTLEPTTLPPTTLAPTTLVPTTLAPTTLAPTTLLPTTLAPTTQVPTTLAPTTLAPTTLVPTTIAPTTLAPSTVGPTTLAPTTSVPTTTLTTAVPTTPGVEEICVKLCNSIITDEIICYAPINKEIICNGYLC